MGIFSLEEVLYLDRLLERMLSPDLKWNPYIQTNTKLLGNGPFIVALQEVYDYHCYTQRAHKKGVSAISDL